VGRGETGGWGVEEREDNGGEDRGGVKIEKKWGIGRKKS
jgi:hypothetical protein